MTDIETNLYVYLHTKNNIGSLPFHNISFFRTILFSPSISLLANAHEVKVRVSTLSTVRAALFLQIQYIQVFSLVSLEERCLLYLFSLNSKKQK